MWKGLSGDYILPANETETMTLHLSQANTFNTIALVLSTG